MKKTLTQQAEELHATLDALYRSAQEATVLVKLAGGPKELSRLSASFESLLITVINQTVILKSVEVLDKFLEQCSSETPAKSFMGSTFPESCRGVLYICEYEHSDKTLKVVKELLFDDAFTAMTYYSEIPNAASQVATGSSKEQFQKEVKALHSRMLDKSWVEQLSDYL